MKSRGRVLERPQHMLMRVALGIHGDVNNLRDALQTYDLMSQRFFVHATPTLFNSGTPRPQLSSCFLQGIFDDSIAGIYNSLKDCAFISKYAGGIGLHIHNIRARNSMIRGTNGVSTGIVPMLRVFNNTARYVNQCFTPDTPVYTRENGMIPIVDVAIGDHVMTSDGTFKPVLRKFENVIDREILEIHGSGLYEPVRVTNEHKILFKSRITGQIGYKYADDLNVREDMVGFTKHAASTFEYSDNGDFDVFYGMFMIAGRVFSNGYDFCLTCTSPRMQLFATHFLKSKGIRPWVYKNRSRRTVLLRWVKDTQKLPELSYFTCYNGLGEKRIVPRMLSASSAVVKNVLFGMTLAGTNTLCGEYVDIAVDNAKMYNDVRYMCRRLGVNVLKLAKLRLIISNNWEDIAHSNSESISWEAINSINRIHYTGPVYDLNIKDNHNYTTALGIVHNSGRRNGSFAIYLEPWHADIFDFLDLKKNHGTEEERARDLFYALWVNDLFMERVKNNDKWSLMCPDQCRGLADVWGDDFKALYTKYESEGKYVKQVNAQELWFKILGAQIETGTPYILYKDSVNRKTNQANLGTIKSSNLCVAPETTVLTDKGYEVISSLKDRQVNVWNGKEYSTTTVRQTGENQKLITVNFSNGCSLRCTPYHKFYICKGDPDNPIGDEIEIEAKDLFPGAAIAPYKLPVPVQEHTDNIICIRVTTVEDKDEYADTYCFNEPKEHKGVFNGVLTGQCVEIMEYTAPDEVAVCNLASICLPEYWDSETKTYNYKRLHEVTKVVTRNLNKVIDVNFYPIEQARTSNLRHRPIGIGIQGLADTYVLMRLPFDSAEAAEVNKRIFETLYHAALEASMEIAKQRKDDSENGKLKLDPVFDPAPDSKYPGAYLSFDGSPASKGVLQFDMWGVTPSSGMYNWDALKEAIKTYGVRNSLLLAPMPTASTSQIMGWNECFEPYTSNIYKRKTLAGEFILVNKFLVEDLTKLGLWTQEIKNKIIINEGSVQNIPEIPEDIKSLYKTVWEIKQKVIIDQAADRGAYICQSQSMNLFVENPDFKKLSSMHFYAWSKGLKTGMYYLRTRTKAKTQQFTMDVGQARFTNIKLEESPSYQTLPNESANATCEDEVCHACSA